MKLQSLKRFAAASLCAVMVVGSMSACGSSDSSTTTTEETDTAETTQEADTAEATESAEEATEEAAEETTLSPEDYPEVTFMAIDFNAGLSNSGDKAEETLQMIKDYTQTNINISWVQNDVLEEKATLALADPKTMPMIMTFGGSVTGTVVSAAKQGAFVDLTEYLKDTEKYPNLSQQNAEVAKSLTIDGKQIGVYRARVIGRYGLSYRADWAEKLGLDAPETVDDVYDMLYAFTYDDPDGNGQDDTIGMEMTSYTGVFDIIQTWFGVGNGWAEVDGNLVPVFQQDEYLEALNWIKKCYDDGLMPSDWATRPTDSWSNGCKNGENGVYIDVLDGGRRVWDYFVTNEVPSVVNPDEYASMNLVGTINGKTLATSGYNGFFTLSASTCDTEEKVEAALSFLDKMNDEEMLVLADNGVEGYNYTLDENGYIVKGEDSDSLKANYQGLNQLVAYIPSTEATTTVEKTERQILEAQVKEDNEQYAVYNPALPYLVNSATYSSDGANLDQIITSARTQYICGEITEDELRAAWQSALDQGYQAIIDEVNEQYHAQ
jgi:putative aldouronate transport system substrate-binding protein